MLTRTKPAMNSSHNRAAAASANEAASASAAIQTSLLYPKRSEPTPASRLPRIPPTARAGKINPIAAKVSPVDMYSTVIEGITDGMRTAAVPMKR